MVNRLSPVVLTVLVVSITLGCPSLYAVPTSRPRSEHGVHLHTGETVPIEAPADGSGFSPRRLFGIHDVWSWFSDKKRDELLHQAKHKIEEMEQRTVTTTKKHPNPNPAPHRRLPPSPPTPMEMGTMFHTLRFFANRIGNVNDDAFTEQERLAALASSSTSSSSSSASMDADVKAAAVIKDSRAKAAQAYGLVTPSVALATPQAATAPPLKAPAPTATSLLAGMEW